MILSFSVFSHWFNYHLDASLEEHNGQLYIHFKNHQGIYVIGEKRYRVKSVWHWVSTNMKQLDVEVSPPAFFKQHIHVLTLSGFLLWRP